MAGSNLVIQQPRNQLLDIADLIGKAAPIFFGSGETRRSETSSLNPADAAQSDALIASFMQRANSTAQADNVVADILYRAQLAFAPVLGDEKKSGLYNTTVRKQMANEAIARATAASAQAVLEDQQKAASQAAALQGSKNQANRTTSGTQKTGPQVAPGKAIAASLASIIGSKGAAALFKKGKDLYGEVFDKGVDSGPFEDASGNLYDMDNFASGGASDVIGSDGVAADVNFGGAESAIQLSPEDYSAIINGAVIPEGGGVVAESLAQADNTGTTTDVSGPDVAMPVSAISTLTTTQQLTPDTVQTLGPIGTQKALEANAIAGTGDTAVDAAMLETGVSPDAVDPFAFDESSLAEVGGDEAAAAVGDATISSGLETMPNLPYYSIANYATEGRLTQNLMDAPILGDVLTAAGETGAGIISDNRGLQIGATDWASISDNEMTTSDLYPNENLQADLADEYLGTNLNDDASNIADSASSFAEDLGDSASEELGNLGDTIDDIVPGGGGDSIICTEAVRQGLLDKDFYLREVAQSHKMFSDYVFHGYHKLATAHVKRMREDKEYAVKMAKWARAWGEYVLYGKFSFRALALVGIAVPLAFCTGLFCKPELEQA